MVSRGLVEQQLVGHDKIKYTANRSTAVVNLTKTLNVRVQFDETAINGEPKRFSFSRVNYQVDQIRGELTVTNNKPEGVVVLLNVYLLGELQQLFVAPEKDVVKPSLFGANQQHEVQSQSLDAIFWFLFLDLHTII